MSSGGDSLFSATLVTTDVLEHCEQDLTANELRLCIQVMVGNKGFRVTRVLDACFSGRGLRNDILHCQNHTRLP
jgi:hypothetical protein